MDDRRSGSLEQRIAALRARMEEGLPRRAHALRDAAARLASGDPGSRDEIGRLAHQLRGTAGSYGFGALGERAAEVEGEARDASVADGAIVSAAIALAIELEHATPSTEAPGARSAVSLEGRIVLAIDDDHDTRRLLELTLRSIGRCDARIVASPREALAISAREALDLVIVDAMMPAMSGLELATRLRAGARTASTPIAFLSAAAEDEIGWTLPDRSAWMRKPFRPRELLARLSELVESAR